METGILIVIIIAIVIVLVIIIWLALWLIAKSKGKIEIVLSNYNYSPGDTINGKLNLIIKKPIKADELNIRLVGKRIDKNYRSGFNTTRNSRTSTSSTSYIYDFKQPIEGAKEYQPGQELSYDFQIKIPKNLLTTPEITGVMGALAGTAQLLSGVRTMIKWYLIGSLEISGVNISKKVQINIG